MIGLLVGALGSAASGHDRGDYQCVRAHGDHMVEMISSVRRLVPVGIQLPLGLFWSLGANIIWICPKELRRAFGFYLSPEMADKIADLISILRREEKRSRRRSCLPILPERFHDLLRGRVGGSLENADCLLRADHALYPGEQGHDRERRGRLSHGGLGRAD